jgi:hypothetical protein
MKKFTLSVISLAAFALSACGEPVNPAKHSHGSHILGNSLYEVFYGGLDGKICYLLIFDPRNHDFGNRSSWGRPVGRQLDQIQWEFFSPNSQHLEIGVAANIGDASKWLSGEGRTELVVTGSPPNSRDFKPPFEPKEFENIYSFEPGAIGVLKRDGFIVELPYRYTGTVEQLRGDSSESDRIRNYLLQMMGMATESAIPPSASTGNSVKSWICLFCQGTEDGDAAAYGDGFVTKSDDSECAPEYECALTLVTADGKEFQTGCPKCLEQQR